ncbi:hypothetical protein PAHAL_8G163600 [Panicum hallii]|nr:hypothetical protein PAHAL_8G163600 [Panicum hallii]
MHPPSYLPSHLVKLFPDQKATIYYPPTLLLPLSPTGPTPHQTNQNSEGAGAESTRGGGRASLQPRGGRRRRSEIMADWAPVFIGLVLFILLSPGLLFQIPGKGRIIEFGNFQTSGLSILIHAIIYFTLIAILLLAIGVHVYLG